MTDFLSGLYGNVQPQFWMSVVEIIWINVLLSGDNAIVIALACRDLEPRQGTVEGHGGPDAPRTPDERAARPPLVKGAIRNYRRAPGGLKAGSSASVRSASPVTRQTRQSGSTCAPSAS